MCMCVLGTHASVDKKLVPCPTIWVLRIGTQILRLTGIHLYPSALSLTGPTASLEAQVSRMCDLVFREVKTTAKTVAF